MAEVLDNFDLERLEPCDMYDWDLWFDGRAWKLSRGEDFSVSVCTMQAYANMAAVKRMKKLTTRLDRHRHILYLQARPVEIPSRPLDSTPSR